MIFVLDPETGQGTRFRDGDRVRLTLPGGEAVEGAVAESGGLRLDEVSIQDMEFKKNYLYHQILPVIAVADRGLHYLVLSCHLEAAPATPTLPVICTAALLEPPAAAGDSPRQAALRLAAVLRRAAADTEVDEYLFCLVV